MKKIILLILICLCLISCQCKSNKCRKNSDSWYQDTKQDKCFAVKIIKTNYCGYYKICLDGVIYWQQGNIFTPAFNKNGTLQICEE
jgi:hypothetical protein